MKILMQALELLFTLADIEEDKYFELPTFNQLRKSYATAYILLRRNGLIIAHRGKYGMTVTKDLKTVTVMDVINALYTFDAYNNKPFYECLKAVLSTTTMEYLRSKREWSGQKRISKK